MQSSTAQNTEAYYRHIGLIKTRSTVFVTAHVKLEDVLPLSFIKMPRDTSKQKCSLSRLVLKFL